MFYAGAYSAFALPERLCHSLQSIDRANASARRDNPAPIVAWAQRAMMALVNRRASVRPRQDAPVELHATAIPHDATEGLKICH